MNLASGVASLATTVSALILKAERGVKAVYIFYTFLYYWCSSTETMGKLPTIVLYLQLL